MERLTIFGSDYGTYHIAIALVPKPVNGDEAQLCFTMSTLNPYQLVLITARLPPDG